MLSRSYAEQGDDRSEHGAVSLVTDDLGLAPEQQPADRDLADQQLVERCQAGQADAFGELYEHYHPQLVRHCARRLGNRATAEDVAQEAFIRAWRSIDRFERGRRFYPWLHVIASNACTDVLRRQPLTTPLSEMEDSAELDDRQGVEELLATSVDVAHATGAMRLVSDRHRRVLHLREELEWSVQDIAAHEGIEANAVDTLLWRARASLRSKFLALSEGAAAFVATGGTHFLLARHRVAHLVHRIDNAWGPVLRSRAALATVIVMTVGAASTPVLWAATVRPPPEIGVHGAVPVVNGSPGGSGRSGAAGGTGATRLPPGPILPPRNSPSGELSGAGSTSTSASSDASTLTGGSGPGAISPDGVARGLIPPPVTTGTGGQVVTGALPAAVATGSGATSTVTGSVGGSVAAVTSVAGDAVPATSILAPVVQPVVAPVLTPVVPAVTGATTPAGGISGTAATVGSLAGS